MLLRPRRRWGPALPDVPALPYPGSQAGCLRSRGRAASRAGSARLTRRPTTRPTTHYSRPATCYLLLTAYYLLPATCYEAVDQLTGDGAAETVALDTTGDGYADTLFGLDETLPLQVVCMRMSMGMGMGMCHEIIADP